MDDIEFELRDGVGLIRFARPERLNVFSPGMMHGLGELYRRCDVDEEVRVVVVTEVTLRNGNPSNPGPSWVSSAGSWNACMAPRHRPSVGSSIRDTGPSRATLSFPRASPIPATTPAIQVAPKSPTATTPDAIGEITVDSNKPRVSNAAANHTPTR